MVSHRRQLPPCSQSLPGRCTAHSRHPFYAPSDTCRVARHTILTPTLAQPRHPPTIHVRVRFAHNTSMVLVADARTAADATYLPSASVIKPSPVTPRRSGESHKLKAKFQGAGSPDSARECRGGDRPDRQRAGHC